MFEEGASIPGLRSLVTLRRYRDLSEAIVARSLLESAEVEVWLRDENLCRHQWQICIGGLRPQVEVSDQETGMTLLTQDAPDFIPIDGEAEFTQPSCPACGPVQIGFH